MQSAICLAVVLLAAAQFAPGSCADPDWPDTCPAPSGATKMPGPLPVDEGYVDFVNTGSGQRSVFYYSRKAGLAAELVRPKPADLNSPAAYRLYDHAHGRDVSSIPDWPKGPCNAVPANSNNLGAALVELRDSVLDNKTSPCLIALLAPDLAEMHGHAPMNGSSSAGIFGNLTWSENGTACFYANKSAMTVWRVNVDLTSSNVTLAELSSAKLELLQQSTSNVTGTVTITWQTLESRHFRFLSGQRNPPTPEAAATLAVTPSFAVCGAARENASSSPPPPSGSPVGYRIDATTTAIDGPISLVDDSLANRAVLRTLNLPLGSPLRAVHGSNRVQLVEDRSASQSVFLAVSLSPAGNCYEVNAANASEIVSAVGGDNGLLLPFNLSSPGWLFTGDSGSVQGQACRRYLLPGSKVSYEVYFRLPAGKFEDLLGYRKLRAGVETAFWIDRIASVAKEPVVDYDDLAACVKPVDGSMRILLRVKVEFKKLAALPRSQLMSSVRLAVSNATTASPLRTAQVSISADSDPKLSQVWLTLLGPPVGGQSPTLAESFAALQRSVAGGNLKLLTWPVAKLDEASAATDQSGGGGGSGPVVLYGHSGGAMAALGFFMLLLGCGLGIVGAWCVWKRRPNMPYYVQD